MYDELVRNEVNPWCEQFKNRPKNEQEMFIANQLADAMENARYNIRVTNWLEKLSFDPSVTANHDDVRNGLQQISPLEFSLKSETVTYIGNWGVLWGATWHVHIDWIQNRVTKAVVWDGDNWV
jgi:hypothetical protein